MAYALQFTVISVVLFLIRSHSYAYPRWQLMESTPHSKDETSNDIPRGVTIQHIANYNVSFVPLVSLILNMIPKLINRITQFQQNRLPQAKKISNPPIEFSGSNPCLDSILSRRQYPGSLCHYYECELHQPASVKCLLQVIEDSTIGDDTSGNSHKINTTSNFITSVHISDCLSIRIYKCIPGHQYNSQLRTCVKHGDNYDKKNICNV